MEVKHYDDLQKYKEEKTVALYYADRLSDGEASRIIKADEIKNKAEAIYLSEFFWRMNVKAVKDDANGISIPCKGSSEYWIEKIYISWEGYMLRAGFSEQWNDASDKA